MNEKWDIQKERITNDRSVKNEKKDSYSVVELKMWKMKLHDIETRK